MVGYQFQFYFQQHLTTLNSADCPNWFLNTHFCTAKVNIQSRVSCWGTNKWEIVLVSLIYIIVTFFSEWFAVRYQWNNTALNIVQWIIHDLWVCDIVLYIGFYNFCYRTVTSKGKELMGTLMSRSFVFTPQVLCLEDLRSGGRKWAFFMYGNLSNI